MIGADLKNFFNTLVPFAYRVGFMPDKPIDCAVLLEEPGDPDPETALEERAFQILVRGDDYPTVEANARKIYDALRSVQHVDVGNRHIYWIKPVQTPFPIGYENELALFSFNFRLCTGPLRGGD